MSYLFVGERRSLTAQRINATWQTCQEQRRGVLCAKVLFEALISVGIDPAAQKFINLWNDDNSINVDAESIIKGWRGEIVGMGQRVQAELNRRGVNHIAIIHPAARGNIRKSGAYQKHIISTLKEAKK